MRSLRLSELALLALMVTSCSRPHPPTISPEVRIQQIPPADPQKFAGMLEKENWRNPYLIVKPGGVALLDLANHEEHLIKTDELAEVLASLPPSAWPYGRVVVVTSPGIVASTPDGMLIRKNRGIVAGTLENMHILINWVPSA